jgi:hypothetical protein
MMPTRHCARVASPALMTDSAAQPQSRGRAYIDCFLQILGDTAALRDPVCVLERPSAVCTNALQNERDLRFGLRILDRSQERVFLFPGALSLARRPSLLPNARGDKVWHPAKHNRLSYLLQTH